MYPNTVAKLSLYAIVHDHDFKTRKLLINFLWSLLSYDIKLIVNHKDTILGFLFSYKM